MALPPVENWGIEKLPREQLIALEAAIHAWLGGCPCQREAKAKGTRHVEAGITHCQTCDVCSVKVIRDNSSEYGTGETIEKAFDQLAEPQPTPPRVPGSSAGLFDTEERRQKRWN